jgi:2-haloalkanoic acid dehalogenase type II
MTGIRSITFDCYGTLIDWEAGVRAYVAPLLARAIPSRHEQFERRPVVTPDAWLAQWEPIQFAMLQPWRPYREVLTRSFEATMRHFGLEAYVDDGPGLARSLPEWQPFPGTTRALKRLARRYRLAIISNIDHDLLAGTVGQLQAPFSSLITAEEAQAYKPDPAIFRLAFERLGNAPEEILHVAFSARYDLDPARALGMRCCRIGAPDGATSDLVVPSVAALADTLGV